MPAGYSKKSLIEKLGIKEGFKIAFFNAPFGYNQTLGVLPKNVTITKGQIKPLDFIQFFAKDSKELIKAFPNLKKGLAQTGMLWVSWPKGTSKVATDLNDSVVRAIGLKQGLVDIKIAAIDETWSGLKFVYRLKDRK